MSAHLHPLAEEYLQLLLAGRRGDASQKIMETFESGEMDIRTIYLDIFQPALREVGRRWELNQVSVAEEHFCTAATQQVMSLFYPTIFRQERHGGRLLSTCVGGELHEVGIRMVSDFFELEGWDTFFLGSDTPTDAVLETIEGREPELVAISATMTFHVAEVEDLVKRIRALSGGHDRAILVGGFPFRIQPDLWKDLGADGSATDASEALLLGRQLTGRRCAN